MLNKKNPLNQKKKKRQIILPEHGLQLLKGIRH